MTRRRIVLISGVLLLLLAANSVYSEQYDIINNYYSDSSMVTAVGWEERYCGDPPGDLDTDGTITAYRDRTFWGCESHNQAQVFCQVWNGTYFDTVDCPSTFNPANRMRFPSWY